MPTLETWLAQATNELQRAGVKTARLDCLVLLEGELGCGRAKILAHPETTLTAAQTASLNKKIAQRAQHLPLAYIRGRAPFYGRDFAVDAHVLVPRPETETMIEMLKTLPLPAAPHIADVGTGSGCIGITAALELPLASVDLLDIDSAALAVAKQNAERYNVAAHLHQQDLLAHTPRHYNAVLANLPYVPLGFPINKAAAHEPQIALFAGADGLDLYRRFWQQLSALKDKPPYILTESLPLQHANLATLAHTAGYELQAVNDFIQSWRIA